MYNRYLVIYLDYGDVYYESDRPYLVVNSYTTLEQAKEVLCSRYPGYIFDMETREEVS